MEKKYKLTDETTDHNGYILHRIKALKDFGNVKKGDLGGWVQSENNLSQKGECWVHDDAMVYGKAQVYGDADITGNANIKEIADYMVFMNNWSSGCYFTWTKSNNKWKVGCFYGTGEDLIKKAYEDYEEKGKKYEKCVKFAEDLNK